MRIRTTSVAILAVTVVGCSRDKGSDSRTDTITSTAPGASSAADDRGGAKNAGLPPKPIGAERDAVLATILDVNSNLIHDEDKAINAARNQCAALDGGATNPDHSAAQRFSYDGVTLTDDDGSHINFGLRKTLCPES
ncbi:hypothetical protein OG830_25645 [Streptomyces sp. NBC_00121]|uniref:hypothetical protein n=1 Tax=unclassified Streptomyces TaxID=2593676 RepID=UPI0028C467E6|nr:MULTISPECIES: hypothetical protein [unclassified Streptomyces]WNO67028.1 hypothetical protein RPQ02_26035 [Streptomyces sp. AM2-3-1]WSC71563.1 hypothetical protein OG807_25550 [Streptomyces sp. NBC_01760]WTI89453.1 hypothetical protein OHB17_26305 [Streptomyces sp. NBC_00724]